MTKNDLITSNMPAAARLAKAKKRSVGRSVYYEELEAAAYAGLVDAANRYRPGGTDFKTYASSRIRGEMDDYVRGLGWSRYTPVRMGEVTDSVPTPENTSHAHVWRLYDAAMTVLPEEGRNIFQRYYGDGLSMRQVGEQLGMSESSVSLKMKKYHTYLRQRQNEILAVAERFSQ